MKKRERARNKHNKPRYRQFGLLWSYSETGSVLCRISPETILGRNLGRSSIQQKFRFKFRKLNVPSGKVLSFCTDPPQATARLIIVLVSRMQKSGTAWGLGTTVLSNGKGQLVITDRNERTGQSWASSKLVPNIPNRNLGSFGLNEKRPRLTFLRNLVIANKRSHKQSHSALRHNIDPAFRVTSK